MGIQAPGVSATSSLRPRDRALHAQLAGRQVELRAVGRHELAPLDRERLGHHQDEPVALDRADEREADAGVARRWARRPPSPGVRMPRASASSIIESAMRSLMLPPGLARSCFPRPRRAGRTGG